MPHDTFDTTYDLDADLAHDPEFAAWLDARRDEAIDHQDASETPCPQDD